MDKAELKEQSASELLIKCMEDFGRDEPDVAIIVWTTKSGDIAWSSNTMKLSMRIGMLESAKYFILKQAEENA